MNKSEFISAVAEKSGLSKVDAKKAVEAFVDTVSNELKEGGKVALLGFGSFSVSEKAARKGVNPKTKETIEIEVRNPNPVVTLRNSQWIEAGQSKELSYNLSSSSTNNQIKLEVSRIPSVDISRRFDFLYNYQHHCTEQLTSKALPLLFVAQFKTIDKTEAEKIKTNVQEAIRQIYGRQLPNGGFVYWPGNAVADEWISSYAGMFLTLAQEKGYAVHSNVLNKWKRFQRAAAQNWRMPQDASGWQQWQSELQQAFRLYTLALAGVPEYGAMNRMKEQTGLSIQAKWLSLIHI